MSHIWLSYVAYAHFTHMTPYNYRFLLQKSPIKEMMFSSQSYHTHMSHVTHMIESHRVCSLYTYKWVMSHIQLSHVTHTHGRFSGEAIGYGLLLSTVAVMSKVVTGLFEWPNKWLFPSIFSIFFLSLFTTAMQGRKFTWFHLFSIRFLTS